MKKIKLLLFGLILSFSASAGLDVGLSGPTENCTEIPTGTFTADYEGSIDDSFQCPSFSWEYTVTGGEIIGVYNFGVYLPFSSPLESYGETMDGAPNKIKVRWYSNTCGTISFDAYFNCVLGDDDIFKTTSLGVNNNSSLGTVDISVSGGTVKLCSLNSFSVVAQNEACVTKYIWSISGATYETNTPNIEVHIGSNCPTINVTTEGACGGVGSGVQTFPCELPDLSMPEIPLSVCTPFTGNYQFPVLITSATINSSSLGSSSGASILSVGQDLTINISNPGVYRIDVIYEYCNETYTLSQFIFAQKCTKNRIIVNENVEIRRDFPKSSTADFTVFPNPASDFINVQSKCSEDIIFELRSVKNNIVKSGVLNNGIKRISLNQIPSGIYYLSVQSGQNVKVEKIVVAK